MNSLFHKGKDLDGHMVSNSLYSSMDKKSLASETNGGKNFK